MFVKVGWQPISTTPSFLSPLFLFRLISLYSFGLFSLISHYHSGHNLPGEESIKQYRQFNNKKVDLHFVITFIEKGECTNKGIVGVFLSYSFFVTWRVQFTTIPSKPLTIIKVIGFVIIKLQFNVFTLCMQAV